MRTTRRSYNADREVVNWMCRNREMAKTPVRSDLYEYKHQWLEGIRLRITSMGMVHDQRLHDSIV